VLDFINSAVLSLLTKALGIVKPASVNQPVETSNMAKAPKRIYKVTTKDGVERLIEASHPNSAIQHCARNAFSAEVASPYDVARIVGRGGIIVTAGDNEAEAVDDSWI
jgi:hypothetical protein